MPSFTEISSTDKYHLVFFPVEDPPAVMRRHSELPCAFDHEDTGVAVKDVIIGNGIQMMYDDRLKDLITFTSQITSTISNDDSVAELFPFW